MAYKIIKDSSSFMGTNSYLIYEEDKKIAYIIDAASKAPKFVEIIKKYNLDLKYVFLTHGHYDHILEMDFWRNKYGAKIVCNESTKEYLEDISLNLSGILGTEFTSYADIFLKDNEGQFEIIKYIKTPGHTFDGIIYLVGNLIFSGDLIFKDSVGRTDFKGSNTQDLINSIRNIVYKFDDKTIILPGHGPSTTVGYEKINNPFVPLG